MMAKLDRSTEAVMLAPPDDDAVSPECDDGGRFENLSDLTVALQECGYGDDEVLPLAMDMILRPMDS